MPSVIFLRAINVGSTNRCRPAEIARRLASFGVVNIGAVGTFVVRETVTERALRAAMAEQLPFSCEIMITPARDLIELVAQNAFAGQPSGPEITRFVSVLHKPIKPPFALPFRLPAERNWDLQVIAVEKRFVLGLYRRHMKAISYLGKLEKLLRVPATTRSWNTIEKVIAILHP